MLDHDVVSRLDVSLCQTRPNHMTDLRRGKSAYIPVFIPNSAAHVDFIDSLMHISPTSQK